MEENISLKNKYEKSCVHQNYNGLFRRLKGKKKSGFTLIEVIAVIAIIGIMASVLLPKFTNYINEAKKLKVVEQSRKVLMAVESYNMKAQNQISMDNTVDTAKANAGVKKYFENVDNDTNKLAGTMKLSECYDIVNGGEFTIDTQTGIYTGKLASNSQSNSTGSE